MPGQDLVFYGTTGQPGTADGQSQPSAALYLGDWRASQVLHSLASTLTANQTAQSRHVVVDTAQIGAGVQAHQLKWLCMVTGGAALSAARVASFDTATGTFVLDRPLAANAASGDRYRLFSRGNVWPDVSAAQAAAGDLRYRCIAFRNQHAASLSNVRVYFRDLSAGGSDCDRFHQVTAPGSPFLSRASDTQDLFDALGQRQTLGGADGFSGSGSWLRPFGYAVAPQQVTSLATNAHMAIWLRRQIPAGAGFRRSVAIQIVVESTTAGSDPSPLAATLVMPYDVASDAALPVGEIDPDRFVHVGGGVRLTGRVTRAGAPEPLRAVRWALRVGDPGSIATDDDPLAGWAETSDAGEAGATYHAPEDAAQEGERAVARLFIGAGEELGLPQPRLALEASGDWGLDGSADAALPSTQQTYDLDPGAGFWPATG